MGCAKQEQKKNDLRQLGFGDSALSVTTIRHLTVFSIFLEVGVKKVVKHRRQDNNDPQLLIWKLNTNRFMLFCHTLWGWSLACTRAGVSFILDLSLTRVSGHIFSICLRLQ